MSNRLSHLLLWLVLGVFALLVSVEQARGARHAELRVTADVEGGAVFIDDRWQGPLPLHTHLAPGEHIVDVEVPGFAPWRKRIEVGAAPGEAHIVSAALRPSNLPHLTTLPGGCFEMGSPPGEPGRFADEAPQRVCLQPFRISRYEVTVGEFARFAAATGFQGRGCAPFTEGDLFMLVQDWASWRDPGFEQQDDHPALCLSAADALAYIDWLNARTGQSFRLPSEAEWEYAARAGTHTAYWWGADPHAGCEYENLGDEDWRDTWALSGPEQALFSRWLRCRDGFGLSAPVSQFPPNGFGLFDMLGNASEWTCARTAPEGDESSVVCAESVATGASPFVMRGGAFTTPWDTSRAACRATPPKPRTYRAVVQGLRLAADDDG
jgi:formylglycine-generating enzyme required for sulfatase activity